MTTDVDDDPYDSGVTWRWRLQNTVWRARHGIARGLYRAVMGFWPCDCECPSCQREDLER